MAVRRVDREAGRRRRIAAALQAYLKRRTPAGFSMGPGEMWAAARCLQEELDGTPAGLDLVRQAWVDLILMGLVIAEARPQGGFTWRLADAPRSNSRGGEGMLMDGIQP